MSSSSCGSISSPVSCSASGATATTSCSGSAGTQHAEAMVSPRLSRFMILTPWVARLITRMSATCTRRVMPDLLMITMSISSSTLLKATSSPVRSVIFIVFTPFAPRRVMRYASSGVRLPEPVCESTIIVVSESFFTATRPTTESPSSRVMPRTPELTRPIERRSLSWKRTARPVRLARRISESPSVSSTPTRVSPGRMRMAFLPLAITRAYSVSDVFFTRPLAVANTR